MKKRGKFNLTTFNNYLTAILLITLFLALFESVSSENYLATFIIAATFILMFIPKIIEKYSAIDIPIEFEIATIIFIYATLYLGEIRGYYTRFWWWDIALHSFSALALGLIGFMIFFVIYKNKKITTNPFTIAAFTFTFALSIGTLWEIFEFSLDQIFGLTTQKSAIDTMTDLIVDGVGALVASILAYFYFKGKEGFFLGKLSREFQKTNPRLFNKR